MLEQETVGKVLVAVASLDQVVVGNRFLVGPVSRTEIEEAQNSKT